MLKERKIYCPECRSYIGYLTPKMFNEVIHCKECKTQFRILGGLSEWQDEKGNKKGKVYNLSVSASNRVVDSSDLAAIIKNKEKEFERLI